MEKRIEKLRAKFNDLGVDAVYVTSQTNHRYLAKMDNGDGSLLITRDKAYAFEDFRYTEIAEKCMGKVYTVVDPKQIGEIINTAGISVLGIEDRALTLSAYEALKGKVTPTLKGIGGAITDMREVKDEEEIAEVAKAQEITDRAFAHIIGIISTDITENDVAAELEYFMRKNGAEDKSFETISINGAKTSLPHGVPGNDKLQKGFLTMDFGATVNGYHSDMTRTVCIGKADSDMKKLYNTVLTAQRAALEYLASGGVSTKEADKIARDIIYKDYKGYFGHSLGHSVGLEIHEMPALSPNCDRILVPGNIVTVEPGIYIPGKYGTRIEDLVVIRENGITNLTKSPKELIEI